MLNIPDCPEIRCIELTGYPPWMQGDEAEEVEDDYNERNKQ